MGMSLTVGSLFSGIGGLELGLERAGLGPVIWQCELDPFCRRVIAKHWPNAMRFDDVTRPRDWPKVDLICGGFPCQDVSSAGKRRGIGGERSGLWWHFARVVRQVRPRFVIVENVASGAKAWLPHVRHQLHLLGYGTRAFALSAADVGAPHLRRRIFVVADANGESKPARSVDAEVAIASEADADAERDDLRVEPRRIGGAGRSGAPFVGFDSWRQPKPPMVRMVHGISGGMDRARRKALGNAVVPQCAQVIGRIVREAT